MLASGKFPQNTPIVFYLYLKNYLTAFDQEEENGSSAEN